MEKTLIFFDEKKYNSDVADVEYIAKSLQRIIENWNALNLGTLKSNELPKLLSDTETFWYEKHIQTSAFATAREQFEESELRKIIKRPVEIKELIELVQKFHKTLSSRATIIDDDAKDYFSFFEFGENGELQMIENKIQDLKEKSKIYSTSEKSKLIFETISKITSALNEADIFNKTQKIGSHQQFAGFFQHLIDIDMTTQQTAINYDAVKRYDYFN